MNLYEECIIALGENATVISDKSLIEKLESLLIGTSYGKLDYSKYKNVREFENINEIAKIFNNQDFYIIWDEATLPILKCNINSIIENIDDVECVAFDTFLVSNSFEHIIEINNRQIMYI